MSSQNPNIHQASSIIHEKFSTGKIVSPPELLNLLRKNENNRIWILKQLSQLGIDIELLEDYTLNDLYRHCDQIIRSTYSIKYLGMNQNEMGVISRRIDPFKDNQFNLKELSQAGYTVNKFFYPKPLKVVRKNRKGKEANVDVDNLEIEIKKAFVKNNPSILGKSKSYHKVNLNGSWINNSIKKKEIKNDTLEKENKFTKNSKLGVPEFFHKKMNTSSYSRFLSSGMILQTNPNETY